MPQCDAKQQADTIRVDHDGDNPETRGMSEPVENQRRGPDSPLTPPPADARSGTGNPPTAPSPIRGSLVRPLAYASCGMEFVAAVGIFSFGGLWLDRRFGWLPLFTLAGFAVGLALGFLSLYKTVYRLSRQEERERAAEGPRPPRQRMKGSALDAPDDAATRPPLIRRIDEP